MYSPPLALHDFMYVQMILTIQKVLGEIRVLVTTEPRRNYLIDINVSPTPLTETVIWNWADYYSNLSLKGLESSNLFKKDAINVALKVKKWEIKKHRKTRVPVSYFKHLNIEYDKKEMLWKYDLR